LAAAVCAPLVVAGPAAAGHRPRPKPKSGYVSGVFSGTVQETAPIAGADKIRFLASRQSLSAVSIDVPELCSHIIWTALTDAPKALHIPISPNGSFSYDRTVLGDHLELKGRLRGNQATGTVFDSLTSGTLTCAMSHASAFTAQH
jgi:hypothetical protein